MFYQIGGSMVLPQESVATNKPPMSNNKSSAANAKTPSSNSNSDNISRTISPKEKLLRKMKTVLSGDMLNKGNLPIWIFLILLNIVILWSYIVTPIRYSNTKLFYLITANRLYYYLHILLLVCIFIYSYSISKRFPLFDSTNTYSLIGFGAILVIGIFVINIMDGPSIEDDGSFNTPPSSLYKFRWSLVPIYILMTILIMCVIGIEIINPPESPFVLSLTSFSGGGIILVLIGGIYLLVSSIKYNVKKYNLPKTWSK